MFSALPLPKRKAVAVIWKLSEGFRRFTASRCFENASLLSCEPRIPCAGSCVPAAVHITLISVPVFNFCYMFIALYAGKY